MANKVTISKELDKSTVIVIETSSNASVQVAVKEALEALDLVKKS